MSKPKRVAIIPQGLEKEALDEIISNNSKANTLAESNDAEARAACERCGRAVAFITSRNSVLAKNLEMIENSGSDVPEFGSEIGQKSCYDVGAYAFAVKQGNVRLQKSIENRYNKSDKNKIL